jgi:antitoxin component YwqK of YwqJK toxin-antitoxin module
MEADFMERPAQYPISFLLTMLMWSCTNQEVLIRKPWTNMSEGSLSTSKGIFYWNDHLITGIFYELNAIGDTVRLSGFLNGKEHGMWKQFYEGGLQKEIRYFDHGKKIGDYFGWWENGKQKFIYHFEDDEYVGTCREWSNTGLLLRELNYKAGHEEGPQKVWYTNGNIKSNYVIVDGRRYGLLGTKHCINVSDSVFHVQ